MKILHINSYYGAGSFYKNLFEEQIKLGNDISVFLPVHKKSEISVGKGSYTDIVKCYNTLDRLLFFPKQKKILKQAITMYANEQFDIIHAHSLITNGYTAYKLSEQKNIPYIVAIRNTDINFFLEKFPFLRSLGKKIARNAKKVVFLSPSYKNLFLEKYCTPEERQILEDKCEVIPNGIDNFWLQNAYNRTKRPEGTLQLITVGDIGRNKNQLTVCHAIESLLVEGLDCTYTVIGNVTDKKYFNQIVKFPFVIYKGFVPKESLVNYYREADIFILASIHETFGLVYAEAMTQGLPVLYTRDQGFDGQFDEGVVGYSVEHSNPKTTAEKIKMILHEYESLNGNCVSLVKKFRWETIAQTYERLYVSSNR